MLQRLLPYLLVGLGGCFGAIARFAMGNLVSSRVASAFPLGTFVINLAGSFLLGLVGTLVSQRLVEHPETLRLAVGVGFIGAFTTFSTFEYETSALVEDGAWLISAGYVAASLFFGFAMVRLGIIAGRIFS
jgi:CrcB protein